MSDSQRDATVLVVDDEREVADAYALRVRKRYEARTAYGGEAALDAADEEIDVVLLDRRMPDMAGDEVLDELRDRGFDGGVVMVTAVDPDTDVADMPFDDYLRKPVDEDDLFDTIEAVREARDADDAVSELFSVTAKMGVLENRKPQSRLEESEEYQRLAERADELRAEVHGDDADTDTASGTEPDRTETEETTAGDDSEAGGGSTTDATPTAGGEPGGMAFDGRTTALGAVGVVVVLLGGTFSSPMSPTTKLMVGVGQLVGLGAMLALGVGYGRHQAG